MKSLPRAAPTILVILGATGDLMAKKIVPAVFHLYREKNLPEQFRLLGVSRREWGDGEFHGHVRDILKAKMPGASAEDLEAFLNIVSYHKLEFGKTADYLALGDALANIDDALGACANKLFYLSVPPQFYGEIFENLHASGLGEPCGEKKDGWSRIVVEKPFGRDEASAKALDVQLAKLFEEEQIYRIDHYLAKEMLQNVLAFRFGNDLFEKDWGRETIESITIRMFESIGVEERGDSYDGVGALRDVGQNHLLSMLSLITMERPKKFSAEDIRRVRTDILRRLTIYSEQDAAGNASRAQYVGYRAINGVTTDSETETYFRLRALLDDERWRGVPITLESGKRLPSDASEIEVIFRHREPCLCPQGGPHIRNRLIVRAKPKEGITITLHAKKPAYGFELEERALSFDFREAKEARQTEDYEKLLLDCIAGDQTLFLASEEIAAMWHFIDPFIAAWQHGLVPLGQYEPGSIPRP